MDEHEWRLFTEAERLYICTYVLNCKSHSFKDVSHAIERANEFRRVLLTLVIDSARAALYKRLVQDWRNVRSHEQQCIAAGFLVSSNHAAHLYDDPEYLVERLISQQSSGWDLTVFDRLIK